MEAQGKRYIILNAADNVAVALDALVKGERLELAERGTALTLASDIPFEHKFALAPIRAGERVLKYGVPIGEAYRDIAPGEHVHMHNLRTLMADAPAAEEGWSNRMGGAE